MTVTKKHSVNVSWHGNTGYGWEQGAVNFTAPSGFTLSRVEATGYLNGAGYCTVYIGSSYISMNSTSSKTYTWSSAFGPLTYSTYQNSNGTGGNTHWYITNITWYYTKSNTVSAGSIIQDTDFTNVGLSATEGSAISNGNFTTGSTITASEWNSKSITLTF